MQRRAERRWHQVACTVVIVNYIDVDGGLASTPDSTMTMTRCVGASGPVASLTCDTPVVTVLTEPVTSISQCNGSSNGGGGTVRCSVWITNHFTGTDPALAPVTVYQCVGSVITGTGAPGGALRRIRLASARSVKPLSANVTAPVTVERVLVSFATSRVSSCPWRCPSTSHSAMDRPRVGEHSPSAS